MIVVFQGLPGAGKSLKLARTAIGVLYRNKKIYEKSLINFENKINAYRKKGAQISEEWIKSHKPQPRVLWTNLKFSKTVEEEFHGFIDYWIDLTALVRFRDCDVLIDEISVYFDARQWENMSYEIRRWLAQHRKFGIEIYGTAQDFAQCDKAFRRLTSNLIHLTKLFGSRDISATRPNPRWIWGLVAQQTLDPVGYDEEKSKFKNKSLLPSFLWWIGADDTRIFDTRAEIATPKYAPLKHIERQCERNDCTFHKTIHA